MSNLTHFGIEDVLSKRRLTLGDIAFVAANQTPLYQTYWPFGDKIELEGIYPMKDIRVEAANFCKSKNKSYQTLQIEILSEISRAMEYCFREDNVGWAEWQLYEAIQMSRNLNYKIKKSEYSYEELSAIWFLVITSFDGMC